MAEIDSPLTPEEAAGLHAAMREAELHAAAGPRTPSGVDLSPLPERPDFLQKAVDFVTMVDEAGLLERFAEELDRLDSDEGAEGGPDDAAARA